MLSFQGTKELPYPAGLVGSKLADARFLVKCIPGVETIKQAEAGKVDCVLRPGFSFIRGTLDLHVEVLEASSPSTIVLALRSKGIGTTSDVEARLNISSDGEKSILNWSAEVKSLGGLLKAAPQGLVKAAAQKVVADALEAIERELEKA